MTPPGAPFRPFPRAAAPPDGPWAPMVLCALSLAAAAALLYLPALSHPLFFLDDALFTDDPVVRGGWSLASVARTFAGPPASSAWLPLTRLSFLVDTALLGGTPRAYHLTNVLLFSLSAAILPLFLWRTTGKAWRSLAAAALVVFHPMRVESVAWVSERKDVLSLPLLLLCLACHVRYARTGKGGWYGAALLLALLAMLAKPVAVVVPALLLLVDLWPLGRLRGEAGEGGGEAAPPWRNLALLGAEKLPFLALSAAVSWRVVSFLEGRDSIREGIGLAERAGHALAAPFLYLAQGAWPAHLPFRYFRTPWEQHAGALAWALPATAAVTAAALLPARRRPYLAFGWGWYLAALIPSGALVPAGVQWLSDRFTLLPHVGVATAAAWLVSDASPPRLRRALPAASLAVAALLALLSHRQLSLWRDTATLLEAGLPANDDDPPYLAALAGALTDGGRLARAREVVERLEEAAKAPEEREMARVRRLALVETTDGREAAIREARRMLALSPRPAVKLKLADLLLLSERYGEAEREYREALEWWDLSPRQKGRALEGRGLALAASGREEEARPLFEEVLRVYPSGLTAQENLDLLQPGALPRGAPGGGTGGAP